MGENYALSVNLELTSYCRAGCKDCHGPGGVGGGEGAPLPL